MPTTKVFAILSLATLFGTAVAQGPNPAVPGTVNYIDGQAALNGRQLDPRDRENVTLAAGGMLATGTGRAAVVLTPGAYLQVSPGTVVKMIVSDKDRTEISVDKGKAQLAVRGMEQGHDLQVDTANGVQTVVVKNGLYGFDAKAGELRVFDGKAAVSTSDTAKWIDVKGGQQLALSGAATKPTDFDSRGGGNFDGVAGPGYGYGYAAGEYGYGPAFYGDPYLYGGDYGFYGGYPFGFYPGFYGGFGYGFYGGGFGGFRGGFGGFRGRR